MSLLKSKKSQYKSSDIICITIYADADANYYGFSSDELMNRGHLEDYERGKLLIENDTKTPKIELESNLLDPNLKLNK